MYNNYEEGCDFMLAVNYSTLRNNLKTFCDRTTDDMETVVVTRKNEKNIVMMSLEAYNNIMENLFIASNKANYKHVLEGVQQLEAGHTHLVSSKELEELMNE